MPIKNSTPWLAIGINFSFQQELGTVAMRTKQLMFTPNETQKPLYFDGIFLFHFCHGAK